MGLNGAGLFIRRTAMGWDLGRAAKELGVGKRTLQRWEAGQNPIPEGVSKEMEQRWQAWLERLNSAIDAIYEAGPRREPQMAVRRDPESVAWNSALAAYMGLEEIEFYPYWQE